MSLSREKARTIVLHSLKRRYILADKLRVKLGIVEQEIEMLELLKAVETSIPHQPQEFNQRGKKITCVTCTCGEVTKFRVPLNTIDDFKCPKDK